MLSIKTHNRLMVRWVGAAKSGTSLNIDKRCYEFEKESGGQFGKN